MPSHKNRISQFWQELKRRNVVRVITVYAGAAFVILELVDMIREPFELPNWSFKLIIVILSIGFIIAIILSWIYDIHPDEGIVKTELVDKVEHKDINRSSNGWKIASYISFAVIVGLILLNVIPRAKDKKQVLEKSIAVLPFTNDGPNSEYEFIINGYQASVHDMLCHIKDLRVLARSSTEIYQNNSKPIREIARELGVGYLLTASGQIYKSRIKFIVELIDANGKTIWSIPFERQIEEVEDHIDIQSDIAQLVAGEIQAVITPEEKELIEKPPTTDLEAYDIFLRGKDELRKYSGDNTQKQVLESAEDFFKRALIYDSLYAEAYAGLAEVYIAKHSWNEYFSEAYLDSVLILTDKALLYDRTLSEAYRLRGIYFSIRGDLQRAENEFDTGITYNPNDWQIYYEKAVRLLFNEPVERLENAYKAMDLHHGPGRTGILKTIAGIYSESGFGNRAKEKAKEVSELEGDSAFYYSYMKGTEWARQNYKKALEYQLKEYYLDTINNNNYYGLANSYANAGQFENSLKYWKKDLERYNDSNYIPVWNSHRIGYAYWMNGYKTEGIEWFKKQIEYDQQAIQLDRSRAEFLLSYYDMAGTYAFLGEKEKAMENFRIFSNTLLIGEYIMHLIHNDPLLDNIRDEPEFKQIVRDLEDKYQVKYQAEHEQVRQWLEENDML